MRTVTTKYTLNHILLNSISHFFIRIFGIFQFDYGYQKRCIFSDSVEIVSKDCQQLSFSLIVLIVFFFLKLDRKNKLSRFFKFQTTDFFLK